MRIVITGRAGFVGSAVCRYFVTHVNADILDIDKPAYATKLEKKPGWKAEEDFPYLSGY